MSKARQTRDMKHTVTILSALTQVKQWQGEMAGMSIKDWCWKVTNYEAFPGATDMPPAPESLLQLIRCNCSSECSSMKCKNSMQISPACGQSKESSCTNSLNKVYCEVNIRKTSIVINTLYMHQMQN